MSEIKNADIKINRCPFCGEHVNFIHSGNRYWVQCESCSANGPVNMQPLSAVTQWNNAKFADEKPASTVFDVENA